MQAWSFCPTRICCCRCRCHFPSICLPRAVFLIDKNSHGELVGERGGMSWAINLEHGDAARGVPRVSESVWEGERARELLLTLLLLYLPVFMFKAESKNKRKNGNGSSQYGKEPHTKVSFVSTKRLQSSEPSSLNVYDRNRCKFPNSHGWLVNEFLWRTFILQRIMIF